MCKLCFNALRMSNEGILVVNTGSPLSPSPTHVREYLRQFLMDPHIIDLSYWKRWLLVHGIILRFRPRKSAKAYQSIWTSDGSPLVCISRNQCEKIKQQTSKPVELCFRYGSPSIEEGLKKLLNQGIQSITLLALYPQSCSATTGSIYEKTLQIAKQLKYPLPIYHLPFFCLEQNYLQALTHSIQKAMPSRGEHLLISFHSLPERHIRKADPTGNYCLNKPDCCLNCTNEHLAHCYKAQTVRTVLHLAKALSLSPTQYSLCYQSKLGKIPWLTPETGSTVIKLAHSGIRHLTIVSPSFVTDCLETLYEINQELRKVFLLHGGSSFTYIPCLNDSIEWIRPVLDLAKIPLYTPGELKKHTTKR